jgi:diadenylate cyclase
MNFAEFFERHWKDGLEILLIASAIYYSWIFFRGTRGAKVLTGMAVLVLVVTLLSQVLELQVIGYILRNLSTFLIFALLVIFQPELRRGLAAVGSHRLFATTTQNQANIEAMADAAFDLASRQLGALIAIERDTTLEAYAESGVPLDSVLSAELLITIFFQKTPLHDGGVIVRRDRIVAAACTFPASQRTDLERTLGMRHRAAMGVSEESDAVVIVASEETGIVSICHRGKIERDFTPATLKTRLAELLIGKNEKTPAAKLAREADLPRSGDHAVGGDKKERSDDRLAF